MDANAAARRVAGVGSPAVEVLAIYGGDSTKTREGSTPRVVSSGGGAAGGTFSNGRETEERETDALARQALGIPSDGGVKGVRRDDSGYHGMVKAYGVRDEF